MIRRLICAILILNLPIVTFSHTRNFMHALFLKDHECILRKEKQCPEFNLIPLTKEKEAAYVLAHNGIRSRIAERFRVANMLRLYWDPELQMVAERWLALCNRTLDPCANSRDHRCFSNSDRKECIRQNFAFVTTKYSYLPKYFDTTVFTNWYNEGAQATKNIVSITKSGETLYYFDINNHFSLMANPNVYRFGCAVATYNQSFGVVCNYLIDPKRLSYFKLGKPGTKCDTQYPRHSRAYDRLCAGDNVSNIRYSNILFILVIFVNIFIL